MIEHGLPSAPTQYRLYGYTADGFYRSKDPTNSIKILKEKATKNKANNENNKIHISTDNNIHNKGYTQNKHNKSPSLH